MRSRLKSEGRTERWSPESMQSVVTIHNIKTCRGELLHAEERSWRQGRRSMNFFCFTDSPAEIPECHQLQLMTLAHLKLRSPKTIDLRWQKLT